MDDGDAPHIVTWDFKMGQSHSPPSTPRIDERKYASPSILHPVVPVVDTISAVSPLNGTVQSATWTFCSAPLRPNLYATVL